MRPVSIIAAGLLVALAAGATRAKEFRCPIGDCRIEADESVWSDEAKHLSTGATVLLHPADGADAEVFLTLRPRGAGIETPRQAFEKDARTLGLIYGSLEITADDDVVLSGASAHRVVFRAGGRRFLRFTLFTGGFTLLFGLSAVETIWDPWREQFRSIEASFRLGPAEAGVAGAEDPADGGDQARLQARTSQPYLLTLDGADHLQAEVTLQAGAEGITLRGVRVALRDAGGRALAFRWLEGPELAARLRVFRPDGRELPLVTALPARGRALLLLPRLTLPPGFTGAGRVEVEVPQPTGRPLTVALQPRPVPSKSLRFKLPVRGTWRAVRGPADQGLLRRAAVVEGGRLYLPRRYALDLVAVDRRGERPRGAPRNEDYPAFGAPVYAPFAGTVTAAVDGHADNPPGMMSPTTTFGNHLRLEHPGGARTLLAHLQQGSLKVKAGDQVRVGDLLAAVGNSGRSAEPHLYLEVCDGERPRCQGLPVIFDAFEVPAVTGWRPITDSAIDEGWVLKAP